MNHFLSCLRFRHLAMLALFPVVSGATPYFSEVSLSGLEEGKNLDARLNVNIEGESLECLGKVILGEFSMFACGDQRQAQGEFQTFNGHENAILAIYKSGQHQGHLYLLSRLGQTYTPVLGVSILSSGFGSLGQFESQVLNPMKNDLTEKEVFEVLPLLLKDFSLEPKLSDIQALVDSGKHVVLMRELKKAQVPVEVQPTKQDQTEQDQTKQEDKSIPALEETSVELPTQAPIPTPRPEFVDQGSQEKVQPKTKKKKRSKVYVNRGGNVEVVEVPHRYDDEPMFDDFDPNDPFASPIDLRD